MRVDNFANVPTQVASAFIHMESYTHGTNLIVSKAEGEPTFIGRAYEMTPLSGGGSEFSGLIQNILKMASDDALVQFSLISAPDYDVPYNMARGKHHGNDLLQELINRQARLYEKALCIDSLSNIPAINRKTLVVSYKTPVDKADDAALSVALDAQDEFLAGLKGCGFSDARVLDPAQLIGIYRQFADIYKPRRAALLDDLLDLRQQAYGPDDYFDFRPAEFGILNKEIFCAAVVPKTLPREVQTGLMNLIAGAPLNTGPAKDGGGLRAKTPYIITATVRVANQRKEADRVALAIKSRSRDEKLPFNLGVENREEILKDLKYLETTCSDGTNKYTYASLTAFVFAKDRKQLLAAKSAFKQTMDNLDFDARGVTDTIGVRFAQCLPLNYSLSLAEKLENEALMPAGSAACLLPIYGDYQGNADLRSGHSGAVFLTRRGSAFYWDMFRTNGNKNGLLAARSGAGKSFKMQYIIETELASGSRVVLFDNGRSSQKFTDAVEGDFVQFASNQEHKPSLNPFSNLSEEEFEDQAETISALVLKMAYFNERIENGARIAVSEAVKAAYGSKGPKADVSTVIGSLKQLVSQTANDQQISEVVMAARNLIPRLENFVGTPARGGFFTGASSINTRRRFTVYELSGLDGDPHLKQCVLFFVMNDLMRLIKHEEGRKVIMLDEAWELLRDEGAAAVMEGLYRKARKDGGSIWVITQSPADCHGNPTGEVILSQSAWKLVMEQEPEEVDKIVNNGIMTKFASDEFFNKLIKDIRTVKGVFSEVLICGEHGYEAVRLYVDRFTAALFSTDGEDRDAVFKLMREGVRAVDAVNMIIGETKTKRMRWLKDIIGQLRRHEKLTDIDIRRELEEALDD